MRILFVLLISAGLFLPSCAYLGKTGNRVAALFRGEEARPDADREIARLNSAGEYGRALTLIRAEIRKGRDETAFGGLYAEAWNGLIQKGIGLYRAGEHHRAGMIFSTAYRSRPTAASILAGMEYSVEDIERLIKECSEKMMERGLQEYRKGNLGNAIAVWEKILMFNPSYREARRAMETASTQLKNLQRID